MTAVVSQELVQSSLDALCAVGRQVDAAARWIPPEPGLYAVTATPVGLLALGLTGMTSNDPIYVGKAEKSLRARDEGGHFHSGSTGHSTLRRSLAALLREELGLLPVPRSRTEVTVRSYALTPEGEERLTNWMLRELRISFWIKTGEGDLADVERAVLRRLRPPLNLTHVGEPRARLKARRAAILAEARTARRESSGHVILSS